MQSESVSPPFQRDEAGTGASSSTDPAPIAVNEDNEPDGSEEGQGPRAAAIPIGPTREEMDQHMLTHIPYRQWCQHCVSGKAKGHPHRSAAGHIREIPTVVMDYMYMKAQPGNREEEGMPILVTCDQVTATGVDRKHNGQSGTSEGSQ